MNASFHRETLERVKVLGAPGVGIVLFRIVRENCSHERRQGHGIDVAVDLKLFGFKRFKVKALMPSLMNQPVGLDGNRGGVRVACESKVHLGCCKLRAGHKRNTSVLKLTCQCVKNQARGDEPVPR